ncbi:Lipase 8 [Candida viswanathii]|uniref:Lipase n=1 Tax=Candida viswanathii TaxID=5486 RepID=A0A367YAJ0_9ASCO|nr:Lipase 8 [Candida viswanathii]
MISIFVVLVSLFVSNAFGSGPIAAPGTILSHREFPLTLFKNYKQSWLVEVASEDTFGNYNVVPAVIIEPPNANASRLIAYQNPEDSANATCAPSWLMENGTYSDTMVIDLLLRQGYYVLVTDYEGPKLTFLGGKQSGKAVLNGIRAALLSGDITGIKPDLDVILFGVSGGSFASGWAAVLQPTYAPEVKLLAAAVGGFLTNLTITLGGLDGGYFAGFIATGLGGLEAEYPELETYLKENTDSPRLSEFRQYCVDTTLDKYRFAQFFQGPSKLFKKEWNSMGPDDTLKHILAENSLTKYYDTPTIPFFVFHGTIDEIVPITNAQQIYDKWCGSNITSLEFAEDLSAGHLTSGYFAAPATFSWIAKRFNGEQPVAGCSHTRRLNNLLYPGTDKWIVQFVQDKFNEIFGGLGNGIKVDKPTAEDFQIYLNRTNGTGV